MRRIVTAISSAALALSLVASAVPANAAVAGYDSAYAGESAFLTLARSASGTFTVFFLNTGTTTWTKGTSTQVDLAACLEDKTTCNAQDATEAPFNSGWLSATRYASSTQTSVAPGQVGTFTYNVAVPSTQAAGTYRFNGALVKADTGEDIRNEGYFQDVLVTAPGAGTTGIIITPASDTNQTGSSHTVTVTYTDAAGAAIANATVDIFVVNDASPFTSGGNCSRDTSASPNFSGQTACTIDINDPITDSAGKVSFSWTGSAKETHRVIAWTAAQGTVYNSTATLTQGSATKTWIGNIAAVDIEPNTDTNPYASSHTATAQLDEADGTNVALAGASVVWNVVRGGTDAGTTCTGGTVVLVQTTTTDSTGLATLTYTGPADPSSSSGNTTGDCIFAFYDRAGNGTFEPGTTTNDPSDAVTKTWSDATAGTGNTLTLTPTRDGNNESTNHTVTATLKDVFGTPVNGATITFEITRYQTTGAAQSQGVVLTGTRTTDGAGVATFTYTGPSTSSEDRIDACADANADGDCADTNDVTFATTSSVAKFWATAATTASFSGGVLFCDTTNDTIYVRTASGDLRFAYDSGDQFFTSSAGNTTAGDGTPTTLDGFETACTNPTIDGTNNAQSTFADQVSIDFDATTANVSQFELEGEP